MRNSTRIRAIIVLILGFIAFSLGMTAQNVVLEGKTFTVKCDTAKNEPTGYFYKTKDGVSYPIYLSKRGAAYIIRVSKKTGKQYPQYLPAEIAEQILKKNG